MSFTVRQVTRHAGGGEIVRAQSFDAAEITVGRAADCDIQLTDLSLGLRHARLRQTAARRVALEATGAPIEVEGRFAARADLDVAGQTVLRMGDHLLTLSPGEAAGEIVVTVTRDPAAAAPGSDEQKTFALRAPGFGKRRMAWLLGLAVLVLCLAWPILAFHLQGPARIRPDRQWSSGPLSKAHAFLEKDCQSCHQKAFVAVGDPACLTCHSLGAAAPERLAVAARVRVAGSPFAPKLIADHAGHARLLRAAPLPDDWPGKAEAVLRRSFNRPSDRCTGCHTEHLTVAGGGTGPSKPAPRPKPALAAVNSCVDCHGQLRERLKDTALADVRDWSRHPDFHPLTTLKPGPEPVIRRIAMSERPRENPGLKFPHRLHLSATNGVARLALVLGSGQGYGAPLECASCHRPDKTGRGFAPIEMERDCRACHSLAFARVGGVLRDLPHGKPEKVEATLRSVYEGGGWRGPAEPARRPPGLGAEARRAELRAAPRPAVSALVAAGVRSAFSPGGTCWDCHTVLRPKDPASLAFGVAPVALTQRYLSRGGFDHGLAEHHSDAKGQATCDNCHAARTSDSADDLMLPRIADCAACHGKAKAQVPAAASADCSLCHGYHAPSAPAPLPTDELGSALRPGRIAWTSGP